MKNYSKIILAIITIIFLFSCDNDDANNSFACNVKNPAENLPWLKTKIESFEEFPTIYEYMYVQQGTYAGQIVFMVGNCCPFCDSYFPVYNCEGEELKGLNFQDISELKTIWKPLGSECSF